jgi:hypothetical protein
MDRKYRHWFSIGFILIWGGLLFAACRDKAVEVPPGPTAVEPSKTPVQTAAPGIPPATLTQLAMEDLVATSLAEHPRMTATPEPPELDANMAAARAAGQARRDAIATAMKQQTLAAQQTPTPGMATLIIPAAPPSQIDGIIASDEWNGATSLTITLNGGHVTVQIQHDEAALFIAFSGLSQTGQHLFPELLFDGQNNKSNNQMDENDWWFQAAVTPCWGNGQNAVWQQCGTPDNWRVSAWTAGADVVEMAIPYDTIRLIPGDTQSIGLAFVLLDVTTDGREIRYFWPNMAELNAPQTWGTALAADDW